MFRLFSSCINSNKEDSNSQALRPNFVIESSPMTEPWLWYRINQNALNILTEKYSLYKVNDTQWVVSPDGRESRKAVGRYSFYITSTHPSKVCIWSSHAKTRRENLDEFKGLKAKNEIAYEGEITFNKKQQMVNWSNSLKKKPNPFGMFNTFRARIHPAVVDTPSEMPRHTS